MKWDWIPIEKKLPKEDAIVFCKNKYAIFIGGQSYMADDCWMWGKCDWPLFNLKTNEWEGEIEIDDQYDVTHWMEMPRMRE